MEERQRFSISIPEREHWWAWFLVRDHTIKRRKTEPRDTQQVETSLLGWQYPILSLQTYPPSKTNLMNPKLSGSFLTRLNLRHVCFCQWRMAARARRLPILSWDKEREREKSISFIRPLPLSKALYTFRGSSPESFIWLLNHFRRNGRLDCWVFEMLIIKMTKSSLLSESLRGNYLFEHTWHTLC